MHEYRVTITNVREQYMYQPVAESKSAAKGEARRAAYADGWNGLGTVEAVRLD